MGPSSQVLVLSEFSPLRDPSSREAKERECGPSSTKQARKSPKTSIQVVTGVSLRRGELLHEDNIPEQ
jgi:hypothetical protein